MAACAARPRATKLVESGNWLKSFSKDRIHIQCSVKREPSVWSQRAFFLPQAKSAPRASGEVARHSAQASTASATLREERADP